MKLSLIQNANLTANLRVTLKRSVILLALFAAGCMKPTGQQTLIDPAADQSYKPDAAYSPEAMNTNWRTRIENEIPDETDGNSADNSAAERQGKPDGQAKANNVHVSQASGRSSVQVNAPSVSVKIVTAHASATTTEPSQATGDLTSPQAAPVAHPEVKTNLANRPEPTAPAKSSVAIAQPVFKLAPRPGAAKPAATKGVKPAVQAPLVDVKVNPSAVPKGASAQAKPRDVTPSSQPPLMTRPTISVPAATGKDIAETGSMTPTIYFLAVIDEDKESCDDKLSLHLTDGSVRMKVCRRTLSFCAEQGSCLIKKSGRWTTFNVVRKVNGIDQFTEIKNGCVYGYGVKNICLDPFYSVAADLNIYDPGDVIYIPKLRGMALPNGQKHDGYVIVRDRGRSVIGKGRFDFFSGGVNWRTSSNPFVQLKLNDKNTDVEYHRVAGELAQTVKAKRGYPHLPLRGLVMTSLMDSNTKGVPTSPIAQPGYDSSPDSAIF